MSWGTNPPPAPDPGKAAFAQATANLTVAKGQTVMNNADEDSPEATVTYLITGTYAMVEPVYSPSTGLQVGTTALEAPRFTRTVQFKPASQRVFDKNLTLRETLNDVGVSQLNNVHTRLDTAFSVTGLPSRVDAPAAPAITTPTLPAVSIITEIPIGDLVTHHNATRDAINARLQYQIGIDRSNLILQLATKMIFPGMEAYERAMFAFDRRSTDAQTQAFLAAGQEQTRIVQLEQIKAQFANDAVMQSIQLATLRIDIPNQILLKQFEVGMMLTQYADVLREDALKERLLERTQPLSELTALVHGNQVTIPNFRQFQSANIGYTPAAESIYNSNAIQQRNYASKSAAQQQVFSTLLGFGANLIGGGGFG